MEAFQALLTQAAAKLLADNLTLTEQAACEAAQTACMQLLRQICARALDPCVCSAQALREVRALCIQAQLFFREQGL